MKSLWITLFALIIAATCLPSSVSAQFNFGRTWDNTDGELLFDLKTKDSTGYFALYRLGYIRSAIVRLDRNGEILWSRKFNRVFSKLDLGVKGEIYLATTSRYMAKLDTSGNTIWAKQITSNGLGSLIDIDLGPADVIYIAGKPSNSAGWVGAVDSSGNFLWGKSTAQTFLLTDMSARRTGGLYFSGNVYESTFFEVDQGVIGRMDPAGNLLWTRRHVTQGCACDKVVESSDGHVFIQGLARGKSNQYSTPNLVMRLDSSSNVNWSKVLWPPGLAVSVSIFDAEPDLDSGFVTGGYQTDGFILGSGTHSTIAYHVGPTPNSIYSGIGFVPNEYGPILPILPSIQAVTPAVDGRVLLGGSIGDRYNIPDTASFITSLVIWRSGNNCIGNDGGLLSADTSFLTSHTLTFNVQTGSMASYALSNTPHVLTDNLWCNHCELPVSSSFTSQDSGYQVSFMASDTNITAWHWDFGDGTTSTLQNPVHTYANGGAYNVCLIVSGICDRDTSCVVKNVCHFAGINGPVNVCEGDSAHYGPSTSGLVSHSWFVDGMASGNGSGLDYLFANAGTDTVALIGYDGFCYDTAEVEVTVNAATINPAFSSSPSNMSISFTDNTPGAMGWLWDFGDGNTSTQQSPSHTYAAPGSYLVCLIATGICATDSVCHTVTATCPPLSAAFSETMQLLTANFTDNSSTAFSWFWDFGDGATSTLQNPSHTYSSPGTYTVCLTIADSCSTDTTCSTLTITCPAPNTAFSQSSNLLTTTFADLTSGTNITGWLWDFGDGSSSTQQNPSHTYALPGSYTVCLTVTDQCGTDSTCTTVTVTCPAPNTAFSQSSNLLTTTFADLSSGTNITGWLWDFGDGSSSTQQNPSHTYALPGSYTVCLTVTDQCGTDSTCTTVTVTCPAPNTAFSQSSNLLTATFVDLSSGTNITGWLWDFGDGSTSTQQNPSHTYAMPGAYLVCLTVADDCATSTFCDSVQVSCPLPNPAWTETHNQLTCQFTTASGATTYQWSFGDGGTSNVQNPTHTYAQAGSYMVCLTVSDSCGSDSSCMTLSILTGVSPSIGGLRVYPNPVGQVLMIEMRGGWQEETGFALRDALGRQVWSSAARAGGMDRISLDVTRLAPGLYHLEVTTAEQRAVHRVEVMR